MIASQDRSVKLIDTVQRIYFSKFNLLFGSNNIRLSYAGILFSFISYSTHKDNYFVLLYRWLLNGWHDMKGRVSLIVLQSIAIL